MRLSLFIWLRLVGLWQGALASKVATHGMKALQPVEQLPLALVNRVLALAGIARDTN